MTYVIVMLDGKSMLEFLSLADLGNQVIVSAFFAILFVDEIEKMYIFIYLNFHRNID